MTQLNDCIRHQWPMEAQLTTLVEKHFHLAYFEFDYNEHWDLSHGWNGDEVLSV